MDWRCGSSTRAPALQVQNPEFKPQSHQKEKEKKKKMFCLFFKLLLRNCFGAVECVCVFVFGLVVHATAPGLSFDSLSKGLDK
jgi:hypothetical protein